MQEWIDGYEIQEEQNTYDVDVLNSKILLLDEYRKQIDGFNKQLNRIFESYESGIYDSDVFLARQKAVSAQISQTEQSIESLEKEIKQDKEFLASQEQLIPRAKKVLEIYKASDDVQLKNDLMKSVLDKVVYTKTANGHFKDQRADDFKLELFPKLPKNKGLPNK